MLNKEISFTAMDIATSVYDYFKPRIFGMIIAALFMTIMIVTIFFTSWPAVDQLPQNIEDQSNIEAIGVMIFTDFVVPFEIMSIVLLSSLMGAIYMAKGDDGK